MEGGAMEPEPAGSSSEDSDGDYDLGGGGAAGGGAAAGGGDPEMRRFKKQAELDAHKQAVEEEALQDTDTMQRHAQLPSLPTPQPLPPGAHHQPPPTTHTHTHHPTAKTHPT